MKSDARAGRAMINSLRLGVMRDVGGRKKREKHLFLKKKKGGVVLRGLVDKK